MQCTDGTTLPSRGQCQDRASEDRRSGKPKKVRKSALPPEADVGADMPVRAFVPLAAASKCSKMHVADLLNHLAGAGKHRGRHVEAERLGGLQVDHKVGACTGRSSVHIPMVSSTHFSTGAVLAASATHFFIWLALAAPRSFLSVASFSHAA